MVIVINYSVASIAKGLVKLHDNSFQTPYSVSVENFLGLDSSSSCCDYQKNMKECVRYSVAFLVL